MKKLTAIMACGVFVAAASASSPTDVLGRHNSRVTKTPKYTKQVEATQAKAATPVALKKVDSRITPVTGRYENRKIDGQFVDKYWFNGTEMDSAKYVKKAKEYDDNFANTINYQANSFNYFNYGVRYSFSTSPNAHSGEEIYYLAEKDNHKDVVNPYYSTATLIKDNNFYYNAIAKKQYGQDIGIYFVEAELPNSAMGSYIPLHDCPTLSNNSVDAIHHSSMVLRTLSYMAQKATIYAIAYHCLDAEHVFPTRPDLQHPTPIYIGSHSYGHSNIAAYNTTAQAIDNYVYNSRVVEFASAGNAAQDHYNYEISPTGHGLNVITVGAANKTADGVYYNKQSTIQNPKMYGAKATENHKFYDKPEIMNYSNLYFFKDNNYTITGPVNKTLKTESFAPTFGYTSAATPFTAGMAATLLHQKPFYKWHPELVKALLLTSSIKAINPDKQQEEDIAGNHNELVGKGLPYYMSMVKGNRSRYWIGNNEDFFTKQTFDYKEGKKTAETFTFTEEHITKGKTYRFAIAWLSDGDLTRSSMGIPQDIDLMIYQEGQKPQYSTTTSNPFEMIEYTAPCSKRITVRIIRHSNKGGRVMLGYNMYEK